MKSGSGTADRDPDALHVLIVAEEVVAAAAWAMTPEAMKALGAPTDLHDAVDMNAARPR